MEAIRCYQSARTITRSALASTRRRSATCRIGKANIPFVSLGRIAGSSLVLHQHGPALNTNFRPFCPQVKRLLMTTTLLPTRRRGGGGGILEWDFSEGGKNVVVTLSENQRQQQDSCPSTSSGAAPKEGGDQESDIKKNEKKRDENDLDVVIPENVLQYERQLRKVQAEERASSQVSSEKHLRIIHEDDALLVADKPSGILCVPGLHNKPSLLELVYQHCHQPMPNPSSMIVHRLDMDTSGLVIFAKTELALKALQADFRDRKIFKEYHALVCGHLDGLVRNSSSNIYATYVNDEEEEGGADSVIVLQSGHVHLPLQRDHKHPPFMRVATPVSEAEAAKAVEALQTHGWKKLVKKRPKPSHTEFSILSREYYPCDNGSEPTDEHPSKLPVTRLSLTPHTGRTHQLRVHCAALGHPIVGDAAYGIYGEANPRGGLDSEEHGGYNGGASLELQKEINQRRPPHKYTMCLHATKLSLQHPETGLTLTLEAPVPF